MHPPKDSLTILGLQNDSTKQSLNECLKLSETTRGQTLSPADTCSILSPHSPPWTEVLQKKQPQDKSENWSAGVGFTHDFTGKNMFTLRSLNALSYHNSIAILVGSIAKRRLICDYFEGFLVASELPFPDRNLYQNPFFLISFSLSRRERSIPPSFNYLNLWSNLQTQKQRRSVARCGFLD